ncbi:hypothetical protein K501DRAFT_233638 [Backusella circina FSU 941]|nr:hypothetical protein K501DRAFT_233638 [Backusella circina FSU 941]
MSAINDEVYAKVKERHLTDQELKAIDTARSNLQTHTRIGGFVGATTAFFLAKRKKFNPIQLLAITGGAFLMGSQMGMISGAISGVKEINALPNPQRLINIIRDVQLEAMKGRQNGNPNSPPSHQALPQQDEQSQDIQASYSSDNTGDYQTEWNNSRVQRESAAVSTEMDHMESPQPTGVQQTIQPSAWDKIRSESLPNSTWSKIRSEANQQPNPSDIEKDRAERYRRLRESSEISAEELPRTREETNKRTTRKNQWGDVME